MKKWLMLLVPCLFVCHVYAQDRDAHSLSSISTLTIDSSKYFHVENPILQLSTFREPDTTRISQTIKYAIKLPDQKSDTILKLYENTLQQSELVNYSHGIISSLGNIGNVYYRRGDYKTAIQVYRRSVTYCLGSMYGYKTLSSLYNAIGLSYQATGQFDTAVNYYYKAINFAENIPGSFFKTDLIYSNMAILLINLGQLDKALFYLNKQEYNCLRTKHYEPLCYIYVNKANLYTRLHRYDTALFYAKLSLAYNERYHKSIRGCLINIGYCYLGKDPATALSYFLKAAAVNDYAGPSDKVPTLFAIGDAYRTMKKYNLAKPYFLEANHIADSFHLATNSVQSYGALADVYANLNDYKSAFKWANRYIDVKDSLESVQKANNVAQIESKYQAAEKDKALMQKQEEITRQRMLVRSRNIWLLAICISIVILIGAFALYYRNYRRLQAEKIKNLQQEQEMNQLKAMLNGEEKERNRIGKELHDGIGGLLTAAKMNLNAIQERYAHVPQMQALHEVNDILNNTATEVRKTAHNLVPDILLNYTLAEALQLFCEPINKKQQPQIDLHFYGDLSKLPKTIVLPIYRIVQELIQNIVKHACATLAEVQIRYHEHSVGITIEDNGIGFDIENCGAGLGLKNVQSRVQALNGDISIESVIGNGTIVRILLDVKDENTILA